LGIRPSVHHITALSLRPKEVGGGLCSCCGLEPPLLRNGLVGVDDTNLRDFSTSNGDQLN